MDARDYMASQIKALRKARGLNVERLQQIANTHTIVCVPGGFGVRFAA